jgi:hypothetical protein
MLDGVVCIYMFIIYLQTKFHQPGSSGSLDIAIKMIGHEIVRMASILLLWIL